MRRLAVLVALAGIAIGATACNGGPVAATVGGEAISVSTLNTQLAAIKDNADAACVFSAVLASSGVTVPGAGQDSVTAQTASTELDNLVLDRVLTEDLAAHHRTLSAADLQAARSDLASSVQGALSSGAQSGAVPAACQSVNGDPVSGLPASFATEAVHLLAAEEQYRSLVGNVDISAAAVQQYYQQHPSQFRQVCLHVILSTTLAGAQQVHAAIAGGQSFATAAAGPGADAQATPTGGAIPCELAPTITSTFGAGLAATILAATPGQLLAPAPWTDPSTSTPYYLVVQVDSLTQVPLSQVSGAIRQQLLSATNTAVQGAVPALLRRADVTVNPRYGTWRGSVGLQPPVPPPAATVLNPTANQAAAVRPLDAGAGGAVRAVVA